MFFNFINRNSINFICFLMTFLQFLAHFLFHFSSPPNSSSNIFDFVLLFSYIICNILNKLTCSLAFFLLSIDDDYFFFLISNDSFTLCCIYYSYLLLVVSLLLFLFISSTFIIFSWRSFLSSLIISLSLFFLSYYWCFLSVSFCCFFKAIIHFLRDSTLFK